jgi:hypothetical protein
MLIVLPFVKYRLPSITIAYLFVEVTVTVGLRSAANMATVSIKLKASVKNFFILFSFIFYPRLNRKSSGFIISYPVNTGYSKQMPPCQKIEKESLRQLLFMVNRYFPIVNAVTGRLELIGISFSLYQEKMYESKSKNKENPKTTREAFPGDS